MIWAQQLCWTAGPFKLNKIKLIVVLEHDIDAPSDMKNNEWRLPVQANEAKTKIDCNDAHLDTNDCNWGSAAAIQAQAKTKTKLQYQFRICYPGPFKWNIMKSHVVSKHAIAPSDMKTIEWLVHVQDWLQRCASRYAWRQWMQRRSYPSPAFILMSWNRTLKRLLEA